MTEARGHLNVELDDVMIPAANATATRAVVCAHAHDAADATYLLDALGCGVELAWNVSR